MIIGDWNITILDSQQFEDKPGNSNSNIQTVIMYNFSYIPQNFNIPFVLMYMKPKTDSEILTILTDFVVRLKEDIIDKRPVQPVQSALLN